MATCAHFWGVKDWTFDPATEHWVHADPACFKPSPLNVKAPQPQPGRRRILR